MTRLLACGLTLLAAIPSFTQPVFRGTEIFPPEEFAARRARVMAQIGDAAAIVLGATEPAGEIPFRQNSQFFYLTGVAEPRASLIIDGRAKTSTVFLQPRTATQEKSREGPGLGPARIPPSSSESTRLYPARNSRLRLRRWLAIAGPFIPRLPPKCWEASRRAIHRACGPRTRKIRGMAAIRGRPPSWQN
jgi:Aminopeptidase P, N-terminal domain